MAAETSEEAYWLDTKDGPALVDALAIALAGDAHIAIEGSGVTTLKLEDIPSAVTCETPVLRRQTRWSIPKEGFIVLPLEPETVDTILTRIPAESWDEYQITHVQIEKEGMLQFSGCDYFDANATWVGDAVSEALLRDLVSQGILERYQEPDFAEQRRFSLPGLHRLSEIWKPIRGKGSK
jgi:hypothetical protein